MKLICERDALKAALAPVASRARSKSPIPILHHVKLDARDKTLSLAGTDLDTHCVATCSAEISSPGATTVSGDRLQRLVDGMPQGAQILIELRGDNLHVEAGKSRYKLPTLPEADFPDFAAVTEATEIALTPAEAKRLFDDASAAMPATDARVYLFGAYLSQGAHGKIMVTSTDGLRLVRVEIASDIRLERGYIIPKPAVPELAKLATGGELTLRFTDNVIEVSRGNVVFTSKLIDAIFPDMDRLIPPHQATFITVDRVELVAALKRLVGLEDDNSTINIRWSPDAAAIDMVLMGNGTGSESVACECDLATGEIAFRPKILSDMLDVVGGEVIQLHITGPSGPMLIVDPNDPALTVIAMPCKAKG